MEGNSPAGSMIPGASHGTLDLKGSLHMRCPQQHMHAPLHHHNQQANQLHPQAPLAHSQIHDAFAPLSNHKHECGRQQPAHPVMDYNNVDHGKALMSDEDDPSLNTEDGGDGHNEVDKGKKGSPWQRVKWTDAMVRLLITAVSYTGEDAPSECIVGRRKSVILQKKGKWKAISKVMAERGCYVSPQQCEDKFNDLNKRYKRLNDILGRGTSCQVVENPTLLDSMDHLSDKAKDAVRKILSSKQLFYEEMCSYHNGNRLHLPEDRALQWSLHKALRSRDEHDMMGTLQEDADEDEQGADTDEVDDGDILHRDIGSSGFPKRMKIGLDHEQMGFGNSSGSQDSNIKPHPQGITVDMNQVIPEGFNTDSAQKQLLKSRSVQLEEQSLHIHTQMMELERQRFKWIQFSMKKDRELDKMRIENERMKLEIEQMRFELKQKELEVDLN